MPPSRSDEATWPTYVGSTGELQHRGVDTVLRQNVTRDFGRCARGRVLGQLIFQDLFPKSSNQSPCASARERDSRKDQTYLLPLPPIQKSITLHLLDALRCCGHYVCLTKQHEMLSQFAGCGRGWSTLQQRTHCSRHGCEEYLQGEGVGCRFGI